MTVDVNAYLARGYGDAEQRPCWLLVADFYQRELSLPVTEFKTIDSSIRAIARAFRLALSKGAHGFVRVPEPVEFTVVLLGKTPRIGLHHCGVMVGGNLLHAVEPGIGGVVYESLTSVRDVYPLIEFWARADATP